MDSMRDIRGRITSVQKTMKITNAMYLMASSRLKRARKTLAETAPYFDKLQYVINDTINHTAEGRQRYLATDRVIKPEDVRHSYIIITSDKGLAGAYNLNICRLAEATIKSQHLNNLPRLYFIGTTGHHYFASRPELGTISEEHSYTATEPALWQARRISEHMIGQFMSGKVDEIHVIYTKMKNAMEAEAQVMQLLPLTPQMFPVVPAKDDREYSTEYAPSPLEVLDHIVPNLVKGLLYGAMVEAFASEQNARMTAMRSATDNAKEIIRELSLEYNRVRQAAITTELTEVIAGANAQDDSL